MMIVNMFTIIMATHALIIYINIVFFVAWLADHKYDVAFETMQPEELAEYLRRFYGDLASKSGEEYSKSYLINIRAGLNRHVTSPPWNLQINLMHDRTFQSANQVFNGLLRDYRVRGMDKSQHKAALTAADVDRLYTTETLSNKTPVALLHKVYFELSLHCAHRGCEGLRDLRKDSFTIRRDENGHRYVILAYHELEKNHQGLKKRETDRDPRMYEQQGDENCPVRSFEKYLSKLNPGCTAFFQRPKTEFSDSDAVWYVNCPIGKNTLYSLMKTISVKAKLSKTYTNHCLRVTCATVLSRKSHDSVDICSVTGHRNIDSVRAYLVGTSDEERFKMSHTLHKHGKAASPKDPISSTSSESMAVVPVESIVVAANNTPVATEPIPGPSNSLTMTSTAQNINLEKLTHSLFSGVTFAANSNPVFNINFHWTAW